MSVTSQQPTGSNQSALIIAIVAIFGTSQQQPRVTEIQNYFILASYAVLVYDTLLTFRYEFAFIWRRKFSWISFFYVSARYGALMAIIWTAIVGNTTKYSIVAASFLLFSVSQGMVNIAIASLLLGSAYAVSKGNRVTIRILALIMAETVILNLSAIACALAVIISARSGVVTIYETLSGGALCNGIFVTAAVALITFRFGWNQFPGVFRSDTRTLMRVFLQYGVMRFLLIFFWVWEVVWSAGLELFGGLGGTDGPLELRISILLLCRFILEIRKFDDHIPSVPSFSIESRPGIQGRLQRFQESILESFGSSILNRESRSVGELSGPSPDEGASTEIRITREEFPWAVGQDEELRGGVDV
ncbi:hypothetical protein M422DRAFT_267317 [Sphaerobolus stellatus SS14]|uniref:DUF6533 domain-containing protein n=1 Tax=Sphaerobolus stellatus (strain SS14) TaxID=990650 RepID=A0A0C9TMB7_SPHS4|nr:hypothetical protein M422DRAFT_267317 [Sphaerobolus stellatus SS14]